MAEDTQDEETNSAAKSFWLIAPGLLFIALVGWLLSKMGEQSSGATLVRIVLAIVIVGALVGAGFMLMRRREPRDE